MIEKTIHTLLTRGQSLALITTIATEGSTPRLPGSKMVVEPDGTAHGTIGGGRIEYLVKESAIQVATGGTPVLRKFDLRNTDADDTNMICGGTQQVLIERITPSMIALFEQAVQYLHHNTSGLWILDITSPHHPVRTLHDLHTVPAVADIDWKTVIQRGQTCLVSTGGRTFVLDPLATTSTVILIGGGHVAQEVAFLAAYVDFDVMVCENRREFADSTRFPSAKHIYLITEYKNIFQKIPCHENCYLLIVTHSHHHDQEVLAQALQTRARYIGMLGSRKKRDIIYSNLRTRGMTETDLARVHCPVGMAIGSESPREIGISIVGELIAARAGAL